MTLLAALLLSAAPAHAANDPLFPRQWNMSVIKAEAAHSVTRGDGAVIAVIDTGVDASHQDLQGRLLPGRDFVQNDATPQDGDGHGTHVTGIAAASGGNGIGVYSTAPGARVLPVRVLGDDGSGTDEQVARGIDYARTQGADVINLSLGGLPLIDNIAPGEFSAAVQRAVDAGIVVVAAAGNDSLPICEQPEIRGKILCVGSIDRREMRSFFSSGDQDSIMAPGGSATGGDEDILSTLPGSKYGEIAGTSQAAPHVAGVAGLLVSRGVRGPAAVDRIKATARDAGPAGPDPVYGVGILDAAAAVGGLPASGGSAGGGSTGGGGSSGAGTAGGLVGKLYLARSHKISTLRRRGMRARCRPGARGRCRVKITRGRRTLAKRTTRTIAAGRTTKFRLKFTRRGKKLLRRGKTFRAYALLQVPNGDTRRVRIKFRR